MKKIYLIASAKAEDFSAVTEDYERAICKQGYKDINTIGSYLLLRGISPDIIFSSYALRAQQTAVELADRLKFNGVKYFLEELYYSPYSDLVNIIKVQDNMMESIFIIGHNPQLNVVCNYFAVQKIAKIPSMGIVSLIFDTNNWSEVEQNKGNLDFFIYPKQFKYYMPKQIQAVLAR